MGISPGMIPDQQADTFTVNPAFGVEYTNPELNIYNLTNGKSYAGVSCFYTPVSQVSCPYFDLFSFYMSIQYAHPISEKSGFFFGLSPNLRFLQYDTPLYGTMSGNVAVGAWFPIRDDLILGINFTNRMTDIASFGDASVEIPDFEWHYSIAPGIRYNPDGIDMGYSIILSDILLYQVNPAYLITTANSLAVNMERQKIFPIHHFYFRFPLEENLKINNIISLQHNALDIHGGAASYLEFSHNTFKMYVGIEYFLKSIHPNITEKIQNDVFYNNLANMRVGIDVNLLAWIDVRAGLKIFSYDFISLPNSNSPYLTTFEIKPILVGGIKFNFSEVSDLEINLQQEGFTFSAVQPGILLSMQYNVHFRKTGNHE